MTDDQINFLESTVYSSILFMRDIWGTYLKTDDCTNEDFKILLNKAFLRYRIITELIIDDALQNKTTSVNEWLKATVANTATLITAQRAVLCSVRTNADRCSAEEKNNSKYKLTCDKIAYAQLLYEKLETMVTRFNVNIKNILPLLEKPNPGDTLK